MIKHDKTFVWLQMLCVFMTVALFCWTNVHYSFMGRWFRHLLSNINHHIIALYCFSIGMYVFCVCNNMNALHGAIVMLVNWCLSAIIKLLCINDWHIFKITLYRMECVFAFVVTFKFNFKSLSGCWWVYFCWN